jgi:hypothetical protein
VTRCNRQHQPVITFKVLYKGTEHTILSEDGSREWVDEQLIAHTGEGWKLFTKDGKEVKREQIYDDSVYDLFSADFPTPAPEGEAAKPPTQEFEVHRW